jgi:hypothetical protein
VEELISVEIGMIVLTLAAFIGCRVAGLSPEATAFIVFMVVSLVNARAALVAFVIVVAIAVVADAQTGTATLVAIMAAITALIAAGTAVAVTKSEALSVSFSPFAAAAAVGLTMSATSNQPASPERDSPCTGLVQGSFRAGHGSRSVLSACPVGTPIMSYSWRCRLGAAHYQCRSNKRVVPTGSKR